MKESTEKAAIWLGLLVFIGLTWWVLSLSEENRQLKSQNEQLYSDVEYYKERIIELEQ